MKIRYTAAAVVSTVAAATLGAGPAVAAPAPAFQTVSRDGVGLRYSQRPITATAQHGTGHTRSDFDGDGIDDLATMTGWADGLVAEYSSAAHVDYFGAQPIQQGAWPAQPLALATGNFDGDRYDDLAVAFRDERDTVNNTDAGGLWVVPGSADGLRFETAQHVNQSTAGVPGSSENGDHFGSVMAAGDVNGDNRDDLAVGLPGEALGDKAAAGGVIVLLGGATGITGTGATWLDQGIGDLAGGPEPGDRFGSDLTIGKVNGDAFGDVIISAAGENSVGELPTNTGMLTMVPGGATGPVTTGTTSVSANAFNAALNKSNSYVGSELAAVDTNGDGLDEVLTGVGFETVTGLLSIPGRRSGLSATGAAVLTQNTPGVPGSDEPGDIFADSIAVGDVTGDGFGDVLLGDSNESVNDVLDAGSVVLLRGSAAGLTGTGAQYFDQGTAGVPGDAHAFDKFGAEVAVLNLDGTGGLDAVVSALDRNEDSNLPPGGVPEGKDQHGSLTTFNGGSTGLTPKGVRLAPEPGPAGFELHRYGRIIADEQADLY